MARVKFTGGGPLDGKVLTSDDNPEFDATKPRGFLRLARAILDIAERKEEKPGTLVWRAPSPEIVERAKAEQWPEAKVKSVMLYHEYHISSFEETDGLAMFKAYYRGVE